MWHIIYLYFFCLHLDLAHIAVRYFTSFAVTTIGFIPIFKIPEYNVCLYLRFKIFHRNTTGTDQHEPGYIDRRGLEIEEIACVSYLYIWRSAKGMTTRGKLPCSIRQRLQLRWRWWGWRRMHRWTLPPHRRCGWWRTHACSVTTWKQFTAKELLSMRTYIDVGLLIDSDNTCMLHFSFLGSYHVKENLFLNNSKPLPKLIAINNKSVQYIASIEFLSREKRFDKCFELGALPSQTRLLYLPEQCNSVHPHYCEIK